MEISSDVRTILNRCRMMNCIYEGQSFSPKSFSGACGEPDRSELALEDMVERGLDREERGGRLQLDGRGGRDAQDLDGGVQAAGLPQEAAVRPTARQQDVTRDQAGTSGDGRAPSRFGRPALLFPARPGPPSPAVGDHPPLPRYAPYRPHRRLRALHGEPRRDGDLDGASGDRARSARGPDRAEAGADLLPAGARGVHPGLGLGGGQVRHPHRVSRRHRGLHHRLDLLRAVVVAARLHPCPRAAGHRRRDDGTGRAACCCCAPRSAAIWCAQWPT